MIFTNHSFFHNLLCDKGWVTDKMKCSSAPDFSGGFHMFIAQHKHRWAQFQRWCWAIKHACENLICSQTLYCYLSSHLNHSCFPVDIPVSKYCLEWEGIIFCFLYPPVILLFLFVHINLSSDCNLLSDLSLIKKWVICQWESVSDFQFSIFFLKF